MGFVNGGVTDEPHLPDEMYHDISLHNPDGAYQTVFGLNVLPQYRRQGIAEMLMKALIQSARQEGKKGMILTCKDHMIHYYEKVWLCLPRQSGFLPWQMQSGMICG